MVFNTATGEQVATLATPGYPYAIVRRNNTLYITSEAAGTVFLVDVATPAAPHITQTLQTGSDPAALLMNKDGSRLYVSNASSDTVTVIDTERNAIERTILLRPPVARGLPGCTPLGMALSRDESQLFVALADLNAVAVVGTRTGKTEGYIPTGWYPSDVATDGENLLVSCARGVLSRTSNKKPVPVAQADTPNDPQYVLHILEGTVSHISLPATLPDLPRLTEQVLENNDLRRTGDLLQTARTTLKNPGIEHVIYIIKENRTYDEVLGDVKRGNGDPSLVLFGHDVTPNLHALAERFVLLDNFYCCAEVSGDGWNWSTAVWQATMFRAMCLMATLITIRMTMREPTITSLLSDSGSPMLLALREGISGMLAKNLVHLYAITDFSLPLMERVRELRKVAQGLPQGKQTAVLNTLAPDTDPNFREFDMNYPIVMRLKNMGLRLLRTQ